MMAYEPGTIVQLRSGGPALTVTYTDEAVGVAAFMYFNNITGLFEKNVVDQRCLKPANTAPTTPARVADLDHNAVFKSSLA